ncbi:hypothetical protein F2P79_007935 [Pimephales promelas]|nr:hypothetical protein F2P79_007935 [Pimephales promelas]
MTRVPITHRSKRLSEGAINRTRSEAKSTARPRAETAPRGRPAHQRIQLQTPPVGTQPFLMRNTPHRGSWEP